MFAGTHFSTAASRERYCLRFVMLRLCAALLLVSGFVLTADRALAQSGLSERADFAERARSAVNGGIAGILTSDCIDPNTPRPYDLTYLGLPAGDPNLSESNRRRLNEHLENAIRTSGLAINVNAAENASVVAPVLARTEEGSRSIERLVNRLYASTFAIAVQALRPAPDVAHIRISIFARGTDGSYGCNRTIGMDVHLPTLHVIDDVPRRDDLVELDGAYRLALAAVAPKLIEAETLTFRPRFGLDGQCVLRQRATDAFTSAYFELKEGELASWLDGARLPPLKTGAEGGAGSVMTVDFDLLEPDKPILDLTIAVETEAGLVARRQFEAVVDPADLVGCAPGAGGYAEANTVSAPANEAGVDTIVSESSAATAEEARPRKLVIIANRDYRYAEPVRYAQNDAAAIEKLYAEQFGYAPTEIDRYEDLTKAELDYLLGTDGQPGIIENLIKRGDTELTIYFAGHGSRAFLGNARETTPYLLGVDSRADRLDLTGYSLDVLMERLTALRNDKLPDGQITLILESCFSGQSNEGDLVTGVSATAGGPAPVLRATDGVVLIAAALPDEVAVWDNEYRQSLFTDAYVSALYGEADQERFGGDGDGAITVGELESFLQMRVSRRITQVRPEFRQTPQVAGVGPNVVLANLSEDSLGRDEAVEREHFERLTAREILSAKNSAGVQPYLRNCIYCPLKEDLLGFLQEERSREAIRRAEERHARQLLKTGTALDIGGYLDRCEVCAERAALEARMEELESQDLSALEDEALWAKAVSADSVDGYLFYVNNCTACSQRETGQAKVDGFCQKMSDSVEAQFPPDKSYDGLLRYLASCNDVPGFCGKCARLDEAQALVTEIESRPDFSDAPADQVAVATRPEAQQSEANPEWLAYQRAVARGEWRDYQNFLTQYP
ncbi:MAG: caspase family protein, partial [Maritimibacter sp.]|nr:caspase family protein [Maritimibacter sp.]